MVPFKMVVIYNVFPRENKKLNLLQPRHFNAIIFPGCFEKNYEYYQNIQNAYKTSEAHGGEGCTNLHQELIQDFVKAH